MTCGHAVATTVQKQQPIASTDFSTPPAYDFNAFEPSGPRRSGKVPMKWIALGAGALVALVSATAIVIAVDNSRHLDPAAGPALQESLSPIKVEESAQAICSDLEAALPSEAAVQALVARTSSINKYNSGDARRAQKFKNGAGWLDSVEIKDIDAALGAAADGALDQVIAKTESIRERDRAAFATLWQPVFVSFALETCGLQSRAEAATSAQAQFSSARDSLATLAASVPWYPEGYYQWADDSNVAWKWVDVYDCSYADWCWKAKIITATGCLDGLYAEISILDSADNVVDFTNDTVSRLGPMDVALMEFGTFNSVHAAGRMAKISCHNF
jgi:hypothetical protein